MACAGPVGCSVAVGFVFRSGEACVTIRVHENGLGSFLLSLNGGDGAQVQSALDGGCARLNQLEEECAPDFDLIGTGSLDVLPRSAVMRRVMEVLRSAAAQAGIAYAASRVPAVLRGAIVDDVLATMLNDHPFDSAFVVSGECGAFQIEMEGVLDVPAEARTGLWLEMVHGLRPGIVRGGIVSAGARFDEHPSGDADIVTLYGACATETALAATLVAESVEMNSAARQVSIPPVEEIWDALSKGARTLSRLRDQRLVRSGVLTLRGRGRLIGMISADRLLRFGVSDWR